jgi:BlaI family transcriptional regulator, penicillinase repressor
MKLSPAEEQLMDYIWQHGRVFMKDLMDTLPDPKPASTTVATLLKRMQEKGFVGYKLYGNSREYFALVEKDVYFSTQLKGIIKTYFNDSALNFASFFAKSTGLSNGELEDLRKIVEQQLNQQKP